MDEIELDELANKIAHRVVEEVPVDIGSYQQALDLVFASVRKELQVLAKKE